MSRSPGAKSDTKSGSHVLAYADTPEGTEANALYGTPDENCGKLDELQAAGVEYVMGFCNEEQHRRFLELCPEVEKYAVEGGIIMIKIWLEVGQEEQERRFLARIEDPVRQWKLSPMDLESFRRWYAFSRARDMMLKSTDSRHAPWHVVRSDDKRRARLNCITHILGRIPFEKVPHRPRDGTKFKSGVVVIAGGSRGLTGAPTMVALAAQRTGAGYVQVAVPQSAEQALELRLLEAMTRGMPDSDDGTHTEAGAERLHLDQSALTRRIQRLEQTVGFRLL